MKTNVESKVKQFPMPKMTKPDTDLMTIESLMEECFELKTKLEYDLFVEIYQDATHITGIYFDAFEINQWGYLTLRNVAATYGDINISINPEHIVKIVRNTKGFVFTDGEPKFLIDTKEGVIAVYCEG